MKKIILLGLLMLLLVSLVRACDEDDKQPSEADKAAKAAAEQQARAEALAFGRTLAAAQEVHFVPTPAQAATLEAGLALNPGGTPNGYFTNPEGVSGYFENYDRPFNFIWTGPTTERRTFDGRTLRLADGPGELILKYAGDQLILQKFKGEIKDDLWEGHGEHWIRNRKVDGHNYLHYVGEFKHDRMDGRGVVSNYNFGGGESFPLQYQGEMFANASHGRGRTTSLATGRLMYKGLLFNEQAFSGSREQWLRAEAEAELKDIGRQYSDLLLTDDLLITGFINPEPGRGPLTIFPPEGAENVRVIDSGGRAYPVARIPYPAQTGTEQEALQRPGISLDLPLSDYPASLTLSYDWEGKRQLLRLTVKRPFGLELKRRPRTGPTTGEETEAMVENTPEEAGEPVAGGLKEELEPEEVAQ